MTRWIDADQVAALLKPGMTVVIAGATAEPREIIAALSRHGEACAGVRFVSVCVPGMNGGNFTELHDDAQATAFFATPENREGVANGRIDFVPMNYRAIFDYLAQDVDIDTAILQLPPLGDGDTFSLGISADFSPTVIQKAGMVIGEINERQPSPADTQRFPVSGLHYAVACERPVPTFPPAQLDDTARVIGGHVADLVEDGSCIQIGIGSIPEAVLSALHDNNDLGLHSGLIAGGVMNLVKNGNMTGHKKSIDTGTHVTGVALGDDELIDWAGSTPEISFRPVSYTHDPGVIRQIDNFVSINSALEIDLFGQINAEMISARQISGPGGAVDMMRGAALSRGGRSIVALNATAGGGRFSRIVAALPPGNAATALRTDVDYVVTEYGARRIRHLSVRDRAEALIEIAAPEFRDQLREDFRAQHIR